MNEVDNQAIARAVDSLLNYETVKYFNAEEREARRYGEAMQRLSPTPRCSNETSLAWLNIGQSLITNLMMAGRDGLHRLGLEPRRASPPATWCWSTPCSTQLFRPLDMLGWVYRTIRQGLIDMEAMFDVIDTPAEISDAPGAPDARGRRRPCPLRGRAFRLRARAARS